MITEDDDNEENVLPHVQTKAGGKSNGLEWDDSTLNAAPSSGLAGSGSRSQMFRV